MKIGVCMHVREKDKQLLEAAATGNEFVYSKDFELLKDVDILLGNQPPKNVARMKNLKWVQLNSAGADKYCAPGILPETVQLTNATGAYGLALSEHLLAMLLAMMKRLYTYYDNQKNHNWHDEGTVTTLQGATVVIVGFGDIGRYFGRLVKMLGAYVIGIRRREGAIPPEADEIGHLDKLNEYLGRADIVVSVLPGTPATEGLYTAERFAAMKQGAYFLNAGRGTAVDQEALAEALKSGHLGGAAIDVATPEPLPKDNPLWDAPHMYITPHVAGDWHLPYTWDKVIEISARNLKKFFAGEPLENIVDRTTGYKK